MSLLDVYTDARERLRHPLRSLGNTLLSPASTLDLAVMRLITYGYTAYHWWGKTYSWSTRRNAFRGVGLYEFVGLADDAVLNLLHQAGQWSAVLCFIGFGFRFAAPVCALTMPYLMGLGNNFGKVNHPENLLAITLVLLAFSRASDGLSLDALIRRRGKEAAPSGEYRWPITAAWILIAGMYWSAGVSKLLHAGWAWAFSDNLQLLLLRHHLTHSPPTRIGVWIAQSPVLCQVIALGVLLGELLCPLLLLGGAWTVIFGGVVICLQTGIFVLLGVAFKSMIPVFAALLPWAWLHTQLQRFILGSRRVSRPTHQP